MRSAVAASDCVLQSRTRTALLIGEHQPSLRHPQERRLVTQHQASLRKRQGSGCPLEKVVVVRHLPLPIPEEATCRILTDQESLTTRISTLAPRCAGPNVERAITGAGRHFSPQFSVVHLSRKSRAEVAEQTWKMTGFKQLCSGPFPAVRPAQRPARLPSWCALGGGRAALVNGPEPCGWPRGDQRRR